MSVFEYNHHHPALVATSGYYTAQVDIVRKQMKKSLR